MGSIYKMRGDQSIQNHVDVKFIIDGSGIKMDSIYIEDISVLEILEMRKTVFISIS
jgi:hypothetical protein